MRRYERLAKWVSGVSYGLLAFGIVLSLLTKLPLLPLLFLAVTGIFAARAYFQFAPKRELTEEEKRQWEEEKRQWLVEAVHFYR